MKKLLNLLVLILIFLSFNAISSKDNVNNDRAKVLSLTFKFQNEDKTTDWVANLKPALIYNTEDSTCLLKYRNTEFPCSLNVLDQMILDSRTLINMIELKFDESPESIMYYLNLKSVLNSYNSNFKFYINPVKSTFALSLKQSRWKNLLFIVNPAKRYWNVEVDK